MPVVDNLKKAGYKVKKTRDAKDADDADVKNSQIIFVDYKGVGKKLFGKKEGLGLITELQRIYGEEKRYIIYSSVQL